MHLHHCTAFPFFLSRLMEEREIKWDADRSQGRIDNVHAVHWQSFRCVLLSAATLLLPKSVKPQKKTKKHNVIAIGSQLNQASVHFRYVHGYVI